MRNGAKPHLKCGARAVSLGSEMWGSYLLVSSRNEAAANEPVSTKVNSKWAGRKVNKPGDKLQIGEHRVKKKKRVVEARLFVWETLTACRCSFQRQPSPLGTSWLLLNVGLPGCLFGFCFVCLVSMPAWYLSCYLSAHFLRECLQGFPKHITCSQRVLVSFSSHKKKKKRSTRRLCYTSTSHIRACSGPERINAAESSLLQISVYLLSFFWLDKNLKIIGFKFHTTFKSRLWIWPTISDCVCVRWSLLCQAAGQRRCHSVWSGHSVSSQLLFRIRN